MNDHGPVEIRAAVLDAVAYPDRTIDLRAVPYDEWTRVLYRGRIVEESVAPGAFGAVANRARKFLINMEHDPARWVGSVIELRTDTPDGLRARIKIRRTPEGDQALDDAADGMVGASVGMAVAPSGQSWDGPDRRRVVKAFLDHIALTAQPAYVGAEVLEVRATPAVIRLPASASATPNLDRVLAQRRAASYSPQLT